MKQAEEGEREPLLGTNDGDTHPHPLPTQSRKRSGTAGSGDTSDSYRSRGDLFPSDEEGEEDAVPLDDEFTIPPDHDDRSSNRTKSSKGKRRANYKISRSASGATIDSIRPSVRQGLYSSSGRPSPALLPAPSLEDLQREELRLELEEDEAIEKKRQAAANLALHRGLSRENLQIESVPEVKSEIVAVDHVPIADSAILDDISDDDETEADGRLASRESQSPVVSASPSPRDEFIPARLPHFR